MHVKRIPPHPPSHIWPQIQNLPQMFGAFLILWLRNSFLIPPAFFSCLASDPVGPQTVLTPSITSIQAGPRTFFGLPTFIFPIAKPSTLYFLSLFYRLLLTHSFPNCPLLEWSTGGEIVPIDGDGGELLTFIQSYLVLSTLKGFIMHVHFEFLHNPEMIIRICIRTHANEETEA